MQIVSQGLRRCSRAAAVLVLAAAAAGLAGCGSMMSQLPLIGLPEGAPPPQPDQVEGPAPELRREAEAAEQRPRLLTDKERAALEADLRRAGDRAVDDQRRRISQPESATPIR